MLWKNEKTCLVVVEKERQNRWKDKIDEERKRDT